MKVYILTLPNIGNVGGMLQSYALYHILRLLGKEVSIISFSSKEPFRARLVEKIQKTLYFFFRKCGGCHFWMNHLPSKAAHRLAGFHRMHGITHELSYTDIIKAAQNAHASYIIGSDQVWRAAYTSHLNLDTFFLSFASPEVRNRSIAYAASFGHDEWDATAEDILSCRRLARELKAISVREHSGITLCNEKLGVSALQMPDPAFLLNRSDYQRIIEEETHHYEGNGYIASYLLNQSELGDDVINVVSKGSNLPIHDLERPGKTVRFISNIAQWLHGINNSEYLITDSFHGCVFAIIFNKPFVCLGNEGRGSSRFDTLLRTFHLESRMVSSPEQAFSILSAPIDWELVNNIRKHERNRGITFLREQLS